MTASRWERVESVYHAASDLPATERAAYLAEACRGDDELRREVDELLSQSESATGLLDTSAQSLLEQPELADGQALGPYRIIGLIGSGGMGRVYKAIDTRLGRTVAIKVSRAGFTGRFRREARAVAALNHPHICTLYDLGPNYLVMEYVDGKALKGPMPLRQALNTAIAIADALDAAHRRGVVHRDLKPANILLNEAGPKLLDFGLAKLESPADAGGPDSVTLFTTAQPAIAGTLQYMSPEQLQGRAVDLRSDIFSFGLVLFYMLTGRAAFEADNPASLIAAILTSRPQLRTLAPQLPADIEHLVDRALAKDPDDRWQSARDLKAALQLIAAPPPTRQRAAHSRVAWTMAAILGVTTLTLAWLQWGPELKFQTETTLVTPVEAKSPVLQWFDRKGRALGTVGDPADYSNPALSRDGRRLAVSIRDATRRRDIWIFDLVSGKRLQLTSDSADETNPVWSPDGTEVAYCSDRSGRRDIYARPAVGGDARLLLASDSNKNPMDWASDGSALYYNLERSTSGHEIWKLPLTGTDRAPTPFLSSGDTHDWVALSPNGRSLLYRIGRGTSARVTLRPLLAQPGERAIGGAGVMEGHWRSDGRQVYFLSGNAMMTQGVTIDGATVALDDATSLFRVKANTFGRNAFVVTPDGERFLVRTGA
jgi:eukaryotic-like serine/threonine-protein kinase